MVFIHAASSMQMATFSNTEDAFRLLSLYQDGKSLTIMVDRQIVLSYGILCLLTTATAIFDFIFCIALYLEIHREIVYF
ncbi:hypothetical protein T4B_14946 [Trichinella pseudospiralis]|uniref:Uncharacterized protein n=1 Tax=Trichinella pseudospiralis TaxID=6337 RepID=A0A0V1IGI7_TRIPS|nr:hypothetical protein T4B_14946 [Trichinella pseudospiralis]